MRALRATGVPSIFVGTPSVVPEVCGHFKVSVPALAGAYIDGADDDMVKIYSVGKSRSRLEQHERSPGTAQALLRLSIFPLACCLRRAVGNRRRHAPTTALLPRSIFPLACCLRHALSTSRDTKGHVTDSTGTAQGQLRDSLGTPRGRLGTAQGQPRDSSGTR